MINYKKDEIFIYDDRDFVKQEFFNCLMSGKQQSISSNVQRTKIGKCLSKNFVHISYAFILLSLLTIIYRSINTDIVSFFALDLMLPK